MVFTLSAGTSPILGDGAQRVGVGDLVDERLIDCESLGEA
jgi:hypothetical protein